jgi:hypothetical protein
VPVEDVPVLAERIRFAIEHLGLMTELGSRGYQLVKERYTYSCQAKLLKTCYEQSGVTPA